MKTTQFRVTYRALLLHLFVVSDDLPDAIDESALVIRDESHEDPLPRRVQQHQHTHLTRSTVGEVHTTSLHKHTQYTSNYVPIPTSRQHTQLE